MMVSPGDLGDDPDALTEVRSTDPTLDGLSAATAAHLRRLRLRMTGIYSLTASVALLVFAVWVINSDQTIRQREFEEDLLTTAQTGAQALFVDQDGRLVTDRYFAEELDNVYPNLLVMELVDANPESFRVDTTVRPATDAWSYPGAHVEDLAASIVTDGTPWTWGVWDEQATEESDDDLYARGLRVPGAEGERSEFAVVAVANLNHWMEGHGALRSRVIFSAAFLVVASAGAGYWMAGRSIRPAGLALSQQERLIGDAAHELRTPIARIRAAAEGGLAADEPAEAALARILRVAKGAGSMVDDLLVLSRMDADRQPLETEPMRLDLLAEAVADEFDGVVVEAVPTLIEGDPGLLRRALSNLIANAIHHGRGKDERVSVTVTVYPKRVMVRDEGPGLDPAIAGHLFDRFTTGERSAGHGLGLPIVQWIADAHDGSLTIENAAEGSGVVATLDLSNC